MICDEASTGQETSTGKSFTFFSRTAIYPRNRTGTHSIMAPWTTCSSLPRGLCLCSSPPRGHFPLCSLRDPLKTWVLSKCSHDESLSDSSAVWVCLSASFLKLLGTLVAHITWGETSNQAQDKSQLTSPLQTGEEGGESGIGWEQGVCWILPHLSGFLLESEQ